MPTPPPVGPADLLRQNGVQVTAQRLAVLRAVSDRPHGTADDVAEAVRDDIGAISRQAVYDALGVLVDKGLLRRMQPAGSSTRYEHRVGDNHHHLVCRTCGQTVDVDCLVSAASCLRNIPNNCPLNFPKALNTLLIYLSAKYFRARWRLSIMAALAQPHRQLPQASHK